MSSLDKLRDTCTNVSKKFDKLRVGAGTCETETPMEEKILLLKEMNQMLSSELRVAKLSSVQRTARANTNLDIEAESQQMLKDALENDIKEQITNTALLRYAVESVLTNDELKMQLFKEKIIEQLEYLETTSDKLQQLNEEQLEVMEESMNLRKEIMIKQHAYKEQLEIQKQRIEVGRSKKLNNTYNEQLEAINQKIKKINFMSTITSRLLIFSNINWEKYQDHAELIEKTRTKCTLESLSEL